MSRQQEIDRLIDTLNAPKWMFWVNASSKATASRALGGFGPEAIPSLIRALSTSGAAYAVMALVKIGAVAIPDCLQALRGPGAAYAVLFFKEIGASCVDELIAEFNGEGAAYAALTLVEIGPSALPHLIQAVTNGNDTVRQYAALTLGRMGKWAAEAIPALQAAQTDSDENVRKAAKEALKSIG